MSVKRLTAVALLLLTAVACQKPKIIPDKTLANIFYDAFLTNAYTTAYVPVTDSVAVYEPVFARYGYTVEDMKYTIGNFSKRKSARLGDVVELAISRLEEEGLRLNREVAILDTVNARARRAFTRTVHEDTLVRVFSLRDTARLRFEIDPLQRGDYEVSFGYNIDSLDRNTRLIAVIECVRADGTSFESFRSSPLSRRNERTLSHRVANDGSLQSMTVTLARNDTRPRMESPHMSFRNVTVRYVPFADDAVDSLFLQSLGIGVFNMALIAVNETDSLP